MTIVAIHQPNFFPWVGYFEKIVKSDYFVFLDDVQYSSGTNVNRVMLETKAGPQYLTCPVHAPYPSKIKDVEIVRTEWRPKAQRTIMWEYGSCRFYDKYIPSIGYMLNYPSTNLSQYNMNNIIRMCSLLGIGPRKGFLVQSELDVPGDRESTELIIDILDYIGSKDYYSGVGALSYLDTELLAEDCINVTYQNIIKFPTYSIIDTLMRVGKDGVLELL